MSVMIEWLLEEVEEDLIVGVNYGETYAQVRSWMEEGKDYRIGLLKDRQDGRSWAYVEDGVLAHEFTDAYGEVTGMVPWKYRREMERAA